MLHRTLAVAAVVACTAACGSTPDNTDSAHSVGN